MTSNHSLLSPNEFAKIIGLNPAHFWGATGGSTNVMNISGCSAVWPEYSWQNNDVVSRENVRYELSRAEAEIADQLGFWPAPRWTSRDIVKYVKFYRRNLTQYGNYDVRGFPKSVSLSKGKFIASGQRAVSLIGTATEGSELVYSDADSDGFAELATITLTIPAATQSIIDADWYDLTAVQWIRGYYPSRSGVIDAMIQDPISVEISGSTLTVKYYSWQLVDPDNYETLTMSDTSFTAVDASVTSNLLSSVDVYLEYPDFATRSAEFVWEPHNVCAFCDGSGCQECTYAVQDGCLIARDTELGTVVAVPATWDATNEKWLGADFTQARAPDALRVWYLSGDRSEEFLRGTALTGMKRQIKQMIAYMTLARLERPICECGNARALYESMSRDLTLQSAEGSFVIASDVVLNNPFGSRRGEVVAWQHVSRLTGSVTDGAAVK